MDQQSQDNYSCKFCDFCTTTKEELRSHASAKHKEYKCSICHERFSKLEEIRVHIKKKHLIKWTCEICDKSFANEDQYKSHCNFHLSIESEETSPEIIVEVSQRKITEESAESHAETKTHTLKEVMQCIFCDFATLDKETLNLHLCRHATIDILHCSECGVCFDNKIQLEKHKISHKKKIYYQCGICNIKSQNKKVLIKHVVLKHSRCDSYLDL